MPHELDERRQSAQTANSAGGQPGGDCPPPSSLRASPEPELFGRNIGACEPDWGITLRRLARANAPAASKALIMRP
jgi:hypothetical protein